MSIKIGHKKFNYLTFFLDDLKILLYLQLKKN